MKDHIIFLIGLLLVINFHSAAAQDYDIAVSSYFDDNSDNDEVRSTRILSDGTIVLAVHATNNYGKQPLLLLGGSAAKAAIVRISPTGTEVLSVTRVGDAIQDMDIDGNDNIYVALGSQGLIKLNAQANTLIYSKSNNGYCGRIDVSPNGTAAALQSDGRYAGNIYVYDHSGGQVTTFKGKNFSSDVAIDENNDLVFTIGFRNSNSGCNPVQISYLRAHDFNGNQVWKNYDHSGRDLETCNGPSVTNNMADTRGYRVIVAPDGNVYAGYEVAGGNHIFRWHPRDLNRAVDIVGGDKYHEFYNSRAEHKSFIAAYNPRSGDYIKGQQFTARLENGRANALRLRRGEITVDTRGNIYAAFASASGGGTNNTAFGLPYDFSPAKLNNEYGGGPSLMVMSPDFKKREFVARVSSSGNMNTVAVRNEGNVEKVVVGGFVDTGRPFYDTNALDNTADGGEHSGFFSVFTTGTVIPPGNIAPTVSITSPDPGATFTEGETITIAASASDSDGTISKVEFFQGSTRLGEDTAEPYTYSWANVPKGTYEITAVATDNLGASTPSGTITVTFEADGGTPSPGIYPAESYTARFKANESTTHPGYTGSSYMDYGGRGAYIEWNTVNEGAGTATLTFRYANGSSKNNRQCAIIVNGTDMGSLLFAPTGSWASWTTVSKAVILQPGANTIRVEANTSKGGPNLDKMEVMVKTANQATVSMDHSKAPPVTIYPNPTRGPVKVTGEVEKIYVYYSKSNKVVFETRENAFDLTGFPLGIYFVMVLTKDGQTVIKRLVLQQ